MLQLSNKTRRLVSLLKRSIDHPKITLILLLDLSVSLRKERININLINDSFLRIIFMACSSSMTRQFSKIYSHDKKILEYLKSNKNKKNDKNIIFKIKIIVIYLIIRPYTHFNNFISFELINSYINHPLLYPYISQYFLRIVLTSHYNILLNRPMSINYYELLLKHVISHRFQDIADQREETQQYISKVINLLLYSACINHLSETQAKKKDSKRERKSPDDNTAENKHGHSEMEKQHQPHNSSLNFKGMHLDESDCNSLFILECLTYFAKTHNDTSVIRNILPNDNKTIECIKIYLNGRLETNIGCKTINYKNLSNNQDHFIILLKNELSNRKNDKKFIEGIRRVLDEIEMHDTEQYHK